MKNLLYILLIMPFLATAQETAQVTTYQQEFAGSMSYSQGQIVKLIGAIPQEKFTWRPGDSVRSVSEVILHIAGSTYGLASSLGKALPDGLNPQTLEKSTTNKDEILKYVNDAYAFATAAVADVKDEQMNDMVELPFGTFTKRSLIMIIATHSYEHKGQLIAYTRVNGITPPWSGSN
ncbi:MAG: DinB family protein [Reichenbachiella sp.]|uniref:DinB family protein n=2 Tax=Reichenbachiella sp. TaxID=2184521 RepID=UPI00326321D3